MPIVYLILFFCVVLATASPSANADTRSAEFNIPAQALDLALDEFRSTARVHVFYETTLTVGRRSRMVKGYLTPELALQALLGDSGLLARRTDMDAFAILPGQPKLDHAKVPQAKPDASFLSALQNGVLDLLCRDTETRPGRYKAALEIWINSTGVIQNSALMASTGDTDLDAALLQVLRGGSIKVAPPAHVTQPFILKVAPRTPPETGDCAGAGQ